MYPWGRYVVDRAEGTGGMVGYRRAVGFALAALVGSLLVAPTTVTAERSLPDASDGRVIVGFAATAEPADQAAALHRAGARKDTVLQSGIHVVDVGAGRAPAAMASLHAERSVRYAEPDYRVHVDAVPNDPSLGLQWGMRNVGQTVNGVTGTPGADDHATQAWNVTTGSKNVVIAEVDSGIDYNHPDLAANMWSNPGTVNGCGAGTHGFNLLTGSCAPLDDFGHGTHVAGIMGAVGNNGTGISGVNWTTSLMAIKYVDSTGWGYDSGLISSIDWAIRAKRAGVNVRVINASATYVGTAYSQSLSDEIAAAGANDILFVTAAGNTTDNNDTTARYPCDYRQSNELCVAATNANDNLASFSNYGTGSVQLAAPGANIYSTMPSGKYGYMDGTSMASPQVAGAAALVL